MSNCKRYHWCFSFLLLAFSLSSPARASKLGAIQKNREAIQALEKENVTAAEKALLTALGEDPFNPLIHLNLALVFQLQEKYDKAIKENEATLRIEGVTPEQQFYAHFNAGFAAAKKDDTPLALKHYQAALDLVPDSKETKTNIELLIKKNQSQGGKGGGQGKNKNDKDKKPDDQKKDPDPSKDDIVNRRETKPKFNSESLTKEDVRKILDEIKAQEQGIRGKDYANKNKDAPPAKDW